MLDANKLCERASAHEILICTTHGMLPCACLSIMAIIRRIGVPGPGLPGFARRCRRTGSQGGGLCVASIKRQSSSVLRALCSPSGHSTRLVKRQATRKSQKASRYAVPVRAGPTCTLTGAASLDTRVGGMRRRFLVKHQHCQSLLAMLAAETPILDGRTSGNDLRLRFACDAMTRSDEPMTRERGLPLVSM